MPGVPEMQPAENQAEQSRALVHFGIASEQNTTDASAWWILLRPLTRRASKMDLAQMGLESPKFGPTFQVGLLLLIIEWPQRVQPDPLAQAIDQP
eukprot:CAMPEP_0181460432 /NCGR_PEP_ID=MMETSP1110-20121109/33337_1 /TAXON_ID=174948 /ORGANISM="Symbiodinium sp., Strain CCMP421" /LENGTH=94 /DNA_ID=CAMNT_0023584981 /DNA_START=115 /DNA_END=395 /DNA_ORIENTATION=+